MTTTYSLLNQEAKRWWHHANLRKQGRLSEARQKEREHIRNSIKNLKECYWFSVGRGGFTLHGRFIPSANGGSQGNLQGYGKGSVYSEAIAIAKPSVPRVNTLTVPEDMMVKMIKIPMAQDRESRFDQPNKNGEYNSMNYCHLGIVLACYEALGAEVHWGCLNSKYWIDKAIPTITRILNS